MISSWVNGCFYGHLASNSALANFISQAIIVAAASDHERSMGKNDKAGGERRGRQAGRRPTMTDVARLAGVSQSSVSLVLNNMTGARISDLTRERVIAAARAVGYRL
jgi:AraC-like DNA-binding protein